MERKVPRAGKLFAYGTLLDPRRLAAVIGGVTAWRCIGPGATAGLLYDAGEYPALRLGAGPQDRVPGVVYEFADMRAALARLDAYEGVPSGLYVRRRRRVVVLANAGEVNAYAWVYVYNRSVEGMRRIDRWPPGSA